MTGLQLIGIFLGGYLGDKYNKQKLVVFCMLGHFLGLLAIAFASNSFGSSPSPFSME